MGDKKIYKFFKFTTTNDRDEAHFNKDFEGYVFEGMCSHGAGILILGSKMVDEDVAEVKIEIDDELTPVGTFSEEVDEVVSKPRVIDPFRR